MGDEGNFPKPELESAEALHSAFSIGLRGYVMGHPANENWAWPARSANGARAGDLKGPPRGGGARPSRFSRLPAARGVAVPPVSGELSSFRGPLRRERPSD